MQIEIDFDVFKALTALRESESDSYNAVLRRLLSLASDTGNARQAGVNALAPDSVWPSVNAFGRLAGSHPNALAALAKAGMATHTVNALLSEGAWFDNICFPNGTQFRAAYKGQLYTAEIRNCRWIGQDGVVRTSPSAAASAISNTNVNGWRFWQALLPGDTEWKRLDAFKS